MFHNVSNYTIIKSHFRHAISVCLILLLALFCVRRHFFAIVIAVSILCMFATILDKESLLRGKKLDMLTATLLFFISFTIRLAYCRSMCQNVHQVSDFENLLNRAISGDFTANVVYESSYQLGFNLEYYRLFPHKFLYPFILHKIGLDTQFEIYILQCLCVSIIPIILYYGGHNFFSKRVGLVASIVFIFCPSQILYTSVITEEHFAALVTILIIMICIGIGHSIDTYSSTKVPAIVASSVLIGALCAIDIYFKDWASIVLIAILLSTIFLLSTYTSKQRVLLISCLLLVLISRYAVVNSINMFIEHELNANINDHPIVAWMYESLDPEASGNWDPKLLGEYHQLARQYDYDFEIANRTALGILGEKVCAGLKIMPSLFLRKGETAYSDESAIPYWVFDAELNPNIFEKNITIIGWIKIITNAYYMAMVAGLIISAIFSKDKYNSFILLIIVGAILGNLLVEGQGRYKYSIEPVWCIAIAVGLYYYCDTIKYTLKKISLWRTRRQKAGFASNRQKKL